MSSRYFSELPDKKKLSEEQAFFLDKLSDLIDALKPTHLAFHKFSASIKPISKGKVLLELTLPHLSDTDLQLFLTVESGSVVVSYGWYDHIHFGYGEPDPPADEALRFIHDLLEGNVEVEIVYGWLWTKVTTFRVSPAGERVRLQRAFTPAVFAGGWKWPPRLREVRRLSFA